MSTAPLAVRGAAMLLVHAFHSMRCQELHLWLLTMLLWITLQTSVPLVNHGITTGIQIAKAPSLPIGVVINGVMLIRATVTSTLFQKRLIISQMQCILQNHCTTLTQLVVLQMRTALLRKKIRTIKMPLTQHAQPQCMSKSGAKMAADVSALVGNLATLQCPLLGNNCFFLETRVATAASGKKIATRIALEHGASPNQTGAPKLGVGLIHVLATQMHHQLGAPFCLIPTVRASLSMLRMKPVEELILSAPL